MQKRILYILSFGLLSLIFSGCSFIKNLYMSTVAINNFKGTDAYNLSRAVMREDISRIETICKLTPEIMYIEDKRFHYTVLHFAIMLKKLKSAKALLDAGMSPDVQSSVTGETPLFLASKYSEIDIKFIKLLIEHGANPDQGAKFVEKHLFSEKETPLMQLPTMYVPEQKINMEKAHYLVEVGKADINARDADGRTVAIQALHVRDVKMAYYFIVELKADVTQPYYSPDYVVMEGEEKKIALSSFFIKGFLDISN